jgi:hypothetical protein
MRKLFLFLLPLFAFSVAEGLNADRQACLYDHLYEINQQWALQSFDQDLIDRLAAFPEDRSRIREHLRLVTKILRDRNTDQLTAAQRRNRSLMLDALEGYYKTAKFPVNSLHPNRQPYFIDHNGTFCAVGHLLKESGFEAFARQIQVERNYAYVKEMPYSELPEWAEEFGFTVDELAWIQPGYAPETRWATVGGGTNGSVSAMYGDEAGGRLILAGSFDQAGGENCNQVAALYGSAFVPIGSGVEGQVNAIHVWNGNIFLGGSFPDTNNIAVWNGANWTYQRIADGAAVFTFEAYHNELYAGGEFFWYEDVQNYIRYVARLNSTGNWEQAGWLNGPVYAFCIHDDKLVAGGNVNPLAVHPYFTAYTQTGTYWHELTGPFERLDNTVRALASFKGYLYAAGDCMDAAGNPTFGLARLGNSGWEQLIQPGWSSANQSHCFSSMQVHEDALYIGGDFYINPFIGTFGSHLMAVKENNFSQPNIFAEAAAVFDSAVNDIAVLNNALYVGGKFRTNLGQETNRIVRNRYATALEEEILNAEIPAMYPNPMRTSGWIKLPDTWDNNSLRISVITAAGKRIMLEVQQGIENPSFSLEELAPGIYLAEIRDGLGHYATQKILSIR